MPFEINFESTEEELEARFGDAIIIHDGVESVNGKTGVVTLDADDVGAVPAGEYDPDAKTDAMTQAVGVDENGKLWTAHGGDSVFVATYGTTTFAEVVAAMTAGKLVVAYDGNTPGYDAITLIATLDAGGIASGYVYFVSPVYWDTDNDYGVVKIYSLDSETDDWDTYVTAVVPQKTSDLYNDSGFITSSSVPSAYTSNPADLGTASPGSSTSWARGDHVHAKPSASDVGAVAVSQGVAHAGEFVVVGSDGNITTVTMTAWQGGSY